MSFDQIKTAVTELARPFSIYASGLAVAIGVFVPWATADKLEVAAGVAVGVSVARAWDKREAYRNQKQPEG